MYVAKNISKQPFASICHTCSKPVPRKSILILLLICGDTGALINPGPSQICNICDGNVSMKNNVFVCMECDNYFHKRCMGNEKSVGQFLCCLCINKLLPFSSVDDISFLLNDPQVDTTNLRQYNIPKPSNLSDDHYECFKRKGLHFIHLNVRSLFNKVSELKIIAKHSNAAVICITDFSLPQ